MTHVQGRQFDAFDVDCGSDETVAEADSRVSSTVRSHELGSAPRDPLAHWDDLQARQEAVDLPYFT